MINYYDTPEYRRKMGELVSKWLNYIFTRNECSYSGCDGPATEKDEDRRKFCREHFEYLHLKGEL